MTADTESAKVPFYVMERLVGQNLRGVLEARGALGAAHAYRIAIDVLEALQHAHDAGMIHRDVKPENIFLHRGKNGTETKLLDFGIVRLLDKHASLTRGKFIGTLRYASPEQVTGRPIGPATDIYSAALVAYEMIRGSGPFDDAGDGYAIGAAHASAAPPPLGALVPPEIDALILAGAREGSRRAPRACVWAHCGGAPEGVARVGREAQCDDRARSAVGAPSLDRRGRRPPRRRRPPCSTGAGTDLLAPRLAPLTRDDAGASSADARRRLVRAGDLGTSPPIPDTRADHATAPRGRGGLGPSRRRPAAMRRARTSPPSS